MRPERLELEGFTAYRDHTEVVFEGADLFALTGPTGAGKSSLIDAICFALYGVVPRYGDQKLVFPVISQGKLEARVRLDFSVEGETYTAVRVVRAQKKGATTKEARLVRARDGEVLAGSAPEMKDAVEQLLGLSFDHFTTCVVLPQGDFARFLHAKGADRQKLLVQLLDLGVYGRMRGLAEGRARDERSRRELAELRLAETEARRSHERERQLTASLDGLDSLLKAIDAAQPKLDALRAAVEEADSRAVKATADADRLAKIAVPDGLAGLAAQLGAARLAVEEATVADDEAEQAQAKAEQLQSELPSRSELDALLELHRQRERDAARQEKGEQVVAERRAAERAARASLDQAAARLAEAEAAYETARTANLADQLRAELHAGGSCPVCGQTVHELPAAHQASDAAQAKTVRDKARQAQIEVQAVFDSASGDRQKAEGTLASVVEAVADLDARLRDAASREDLDRQLSAVDEAEATLKQLREAARACRNERKRCEAALQSLEKQQSGLRAQFNAARDTVAALGPPPVLDDPAADWAALVAWADERRPVLVADADEASASAAKAAKEHNRLFDEVVSAARATGIAVPAGEAGDGGDGARLRDVVADERARIRSDLDELFRLREQAARSEQERDQHGAAEQVSRSLAQHLNANGFVKWVLDEALHHLVSAASEILYSLSRETYRLTIADDSSRDFYVVDYANAEAVRSARTLSGGETFLASMALALALAEQVAQLAAGGAARLDSIFIDEGFGTLDADTLDTVATALEDLGAGGRMVGVISHVPELGERLPVRFEVTKAGNSSTVVRAEA